MYHLIGEMKLARRSLYHMCNSPFCFLHFVYFEWCRQYKAACCLEMPCTVSIPYRCNCSSDEWHACPEKHFLHRILEYPWDYSNVYGSSSYFDALMNHSCCPHTMSCIWYCPVLGNKLRTTHCLKWPVEGNTWLSPPVEPIYRGHGLFNAHSPFLSCLEVLY